MAMKTCRAEASEDRISDAFPRIKGPQAPDAHPLHENVLALPSASSRDFRTLGEMADYVDSHDPEGARTLKHHNLIALVSCIELSGSDERSKSLYSARLRWRLSKLPSAALGLLEEKSPSDIVRAAASGLLQERDPTRRV